MGPREGFPWFGKNLSLTGQAGTPEAFPDTPMPLPYGFLVLSSQRVVRAGDQALFFLLFYVLCPTSAFQNMRQPLHSRFDIQDSIKGHHHRLMFITPLLLLQTAFLLVICLFLSLLCSGLQEMIFPRCQIDFPVRH